MKNRFCFLVLSGLIEFGIHLLALNADASLKLLTNGSYSRGALDSRSFHEGTLYEKIQKSFDKSNSLRSSEISGIYAGRCFYSDSPNQPVASLLNVEFTQNSKDLGPAFHGEDLKLIVPLVDLEASPQAYDQLSGLSLISVRKGAHAHLNDNAFATETPRSLVVDGLRTFNTEARTYELRRSKSLIYLRLTCAEPGFCLNDRGEGTGYKLINSEGESTTACYYFKRLRSK